LVVLGKVALRIAGLVKNAADFDHAIFALTIHE
jgi:hypothetical protein